MTTVKKVTVKKVIDARGLSCPEPAILTDQALDSMNGGEVEVVVDSAASRENVARTAELAGWSVAVESLPGGEYRLVLRR